MKEEGKAQRERNDGGEADRGRAWSDGGVKEDRGAGRGDMKEGKQVGEEHGVREGVSEGRREDREGINEGGEAGRREHAWSDRGRE